MPEIVLTDEQAKQLGFRPVPVVVKDSTGRVVGHLDPVPSPEYIAEMKRRAAGPGYSSAAVTAMLDALQAEWDRVGPFGAEHARELVQRLEASEPEKYGPRGAS